MKVPESPIELKMFLLQTLIYRLAEMDDMVIRECWECCKSDIDVEAVQSEIDRVIHFIKQRLATLRAEEQR